MARPKGTRYWKGTGTGTVMTGIGNLYSVFLSWAGASAGNRISIMDGNTAMLELVIANAANEGLNIILPAVGLEFATSLRVLVAGAGEYNIAIGYEGNG